MKLFKYLNPARISDVLEKRMLRFTPPAHLNDPFEALPIISGLAPDRPTLIQVVARMIAALERDQPLSNLVPHHIRTGSEATIASWLTDHPAAFEGLMAEWNPGGALKEALIRESYAASNRIGILSLSAAPNNMLMWSHYASEHRGFVVEFDSEDAFFQKYSSRSDMLDICREPQAMRYVTTRPTVDLESMTEIDVFLTKVRDWAYEEEWRFGRGLADADAVTGEVHLFQFPPSCLSSVILGCNMSTEASREAIKLVKANHDYRHVLVRKALTSSTGYGLFIVDLLFDAGDVDNVDLRSADKR